MTSYPACSKTLLSRKPCIPDKKLLWTLLESHGPSFRIRHEKSPEAPLVDKSRWRHIRLAIKHLYLKNHASQITIYYWSLSGSHDRSFELRHKKSTEAFPGGGQTTTSYPVGNTTSLSGKQCMVAKKLLWIVNWKPWSLFQNPSGKSVCSVPWRRNDDDVMSGWQ